MVSGPRSEWTRFAIDSSDTFKCHLLTTVYHVAHIETALRIADDGGIKAGLVFDKSKLNSERILVTWLSPNVWGQGFRYGNVRFAFDWASLVQGKRCYWVESIAYNVPACRILVTSKDYAGELDDYDPTRGDGPWWYEPASDAHYWNMQFCLEL